jgi:hypothetical protein
MPLAVHLFSLSSSVLSVLLLLLLLLTWLTIAFSE